MHIPLTTPIVFGPELVHAIAPADCAALVTRHRTAASASKAPTFYTHTRALISTGRMVDIVTATSYSSELDHLVTICALATEWQALTGGPPPRRPHGAREN